MPEFVNGLQIRKRLGPSAWSAPIVYGPEGFAFKARDDSGHIVVTGWTEPDGIDWIHASMSRANGVPSYEDLKLLHSAVWPDGNAYQCFVPPDDHINIHERALHLWGRADGTRVLPNFGKGGTI
ncbi:hypothetical protein [Amycolatopsis sp. NPDC059657]|uniref:DUF7694 domain-containing protein n=1 Tax=Amycolatopsis sp. NPDC059657 TaxID=3346899 RepID=UPI003670E015